MKPTAREKAFIAAFALILVLAVFVILHNTRPTGDPLPQTGAAPGELVRFVENAARMHNIDPQIVLAIIDRESNFQPEVTNRSSGCAGLMQLAPCTLDWLENETGCRYDPYDPFQNIAGGVYLLGWLYDRYDGDEPMALLAYAQGTGGAERMVREGINPADTWQVQTIYERCKTM